MNGPGDAVRVMRQAQSRYLYEQWDFRIVHCGSLDEHGWHGWVGGNEDLRCPGTTGRLSESIERLRASRAVEHGALKAAGGSGGVRV
jgi:hypothetical protein